MKTFMIHTSNIYFCQVVALQIMRANYEQLVKAHQRAPQVQEDLVPDEVKFQVGWLLVPPVFK